MNFLTVIPVSQIVPYGIPYIRSLLQEEEKQYKSQFDSFWKYFERTWLKAFKPEDWNIDAIVNNSDLDHESILINRTNNPLERYNRIMNEHFSTPHPTMVNFVAVIRNEAINYVDTLECVKKGNFLNLFFTILLFKTILSFLGHKDPNSHEPPTIPEVPRDYIIFRTNSLNSQTEHETSAPPPIVPQKTNRSVSTTTNKPPPLPKITEESDNESTSSSKNRKRNFKYL